MPTVRSRITQEGSRKWQKWKNRSVLSPILLMPLETQPKPSGQEQGVTQTDIIAILSAAGIKATLEQPFYWQRREHRDDLTEILTKRGCTVSDLCDQLRAAVQAGRELEHPPRRLNALVDGLLSRGRKA